MGKKSKADIRSAMLKIERTKEMIKPRSIFDDITMSDILEGFNNSVDNKRAVKTRSNGIRWVTNRLRYD